LKENVKGKEKDFVKIIDELPGVEKLTGDATEEEKIKNFVANQKSEVVIKAVFKCKLKDKNYQKEIEIKMENEKNDNKKALDESIYPKENGKYTEEAMAQYLFEKKTGQVHQFSSQEKKEDDNTSTSDKGH
jgi:hypothetical protein